MKKLLLSAFADEYASGFEEQLRALCRLGIDFIELRFVDGKNFSALSREELAYVKELLSRYGVRPSAIGSPIGKIRLDEDVEAHLSLAERVFSYAEELGAKFVRIFSFYAPEGEDIADHEEEVFSLMEKLLLMAKKHGVTLCHENEAKIYGDTAERCHRLLKHFGGELGAVFDMGNFVLEGEDPVAAYGRLYPFVRYFHVKDALFAGAITPPGSGEARIPELLSAHLERAEGDFFVTLEPHLQTFSGLNALVGRSFDNPYKYETQEAAFEDAHAKLSEILRSIGEKA